MTSKAEVEAVSYLGISKLISNEVMFEAQAVGELTSLRFRRTGRTTGELLELIGKAMQAPKEVRHFAFQLTGKQESAEGLIALHNLISELSAVGIKYLEVEVVGVNVYIRYNILRGQYTQLERQEIDHERERI